MFVFIYILSAFIVGFCATKELQKQNFITFKDLVITTLLTLIPIINSLVVCYFITKAIRKL